MKRFCLTDSQWAKMQPYCLGKAFDSDWIIAELNERGAQIVISQHPRRSAPIAINARL